MAFSAPPSRSVTSTKPSSTARQQVQPGSVTFVQRFGGALQRNVHYQVLVMEGVFVDRTDQDLTPRFLKGEPPSDADVAHVIQTSSRRIIRNLRRLGYLEAGMEVPVTTGYDPRLDHKPALARTVAASVTPRIAFGERAGEKVRRIGSGCGYAGEQPALTGPRCTRVNGFSVHANTEIPAHRREQLERLMRYTARGAVSLERLAQDANGELVYRSNRPWSDGTTGIPLSPLELLEKLAAFVPLPRAHLVRDGGCLAPHSKLRAAIIPTPRQQGVDGEDTKTGTPAWHGARLLGRVFDVDLATCPLCRRGSLRDCVGAGQLCCPSLRDCVGAGQLCCPSLRDCVGAGQLCYPSLRILAAIPQESVITRILRHLKLASVPPPIAPARCRQALFAFDAAHASAGPEARCALQRCLSPLRAVQCRLKSSPPAFPTAAPRPSKSRRLSRTPASAACPGRALPSCA
jgi:hypothetical protein